MGQLAMTKLFNFKYKENICKIVEHKNTSHLLWKNKNLVWP